MCGTRLRDSLRRMRVLALAVLSCLTVACGGPAEEPGAATDQSEIKLAPAVLDTGDSCSTLFASGGCADGGSVICSAQLDGGSGLTWQVWESDPFGCKVTRP